jgi:hypothetical protein
MTFPGDDVLTLSQNGTDAGAGTSGPPWPILPPTLPEGWGPAAVGVSFATRTTASSPPAQETARTRGTATAAATPAAVAWLDPKEETRGRHAAARSRLPAGAVAVIAATGLLLVAAAYTAGRVGHVSSAWANRAYWLGQGLIVVPAAAKLLGRRVLAAGETVALVTILTVTEYLGRICYSPASFTFPDELEHWRSTEDILQTGQLHGVNYLLPISPHYPGLEELTSAVVSVTGLSVFASGLIVAGVAHLLFVYVLYLLFREVSGSYRIGGVAVLCYASNSHFTSFDSMFIYQTLALPFLGLTLLAAWRLASQRAAGPRAGWITLAVLAIVVTVVTHHVTSYVLVAALALITAAALLTASWRTAAWLAGLALLAASATALWLVFGAPQTWTYLQPFAEASLQSLRVLLAGGHASATPVSTGPLADRLLSDATVLTVSVLLPAGWWQVWRRYRRQPWTVAMAIGSLGWYVTIALRLTAADSSELAGRAATFVFVPAAYVTALAVGWLAGAVLCRNARSAIVALLVVVLILMFDGLANGWPPYWERLPGAHQVAGAERSAEPEVTNAASWALAALGPGHRFAADVGSYAVLGSYGDQDLVRDVAYLYTSPVFTQADARRAEQQAVRYVWIDQRLSEALPASGQYFPLDPDAGKYKQPLPRADLEKFNRAHGVDRVFDSGDIVIYELPGS